MHDYSCMHPQRVRWAEKQQKASHRPASNRNIASKNLARLLHKSVCTRRSALTAQVTRRLTPLQSLSSEGEWLPQLHTWQVRGPADSHREPAAHVKVIQDLQAARPRLQVARPQREGIEGPRGPVCPLLQPQRLREPALPHPIPFSVT